jgi:hypothetical protein
MQGALPPNQFPDLATFGRELLPRGWSVSDPEAHSHSWLSAAEFLVLSSRCDDPRELPHVKAIGSALSSLVQSNLNARVVYWFA